MSQTTPTNMSQAGTTNRRPTTSGRPDRKLLLATEARPGYRTTEFILTIAAATAVVVAAYASKSGSGSFPIRWGWLFFTIIIAAYVVSRGFAKAGSSDPGVLDLTGEDGNRA